MVNEEDNKLLSAVPSMEEVRRAVFSWNGSSACGPDGFSGLFYQHCWDIIGMDVLKMVKSFCDGNTFQRVLLTHIWC